MHTHVLHLTYSPPRRSECFEVQQGGDVGGRRDVVVVSSISSTSKHSVSYTPTHTNPRLPTKNGVRHMQSHFDQHFGECVRARAFFVLTDKNKCSLLACPLYAVCSRIFSTLPTHTHTQIHSLA